MNDKNNEKLYFSIIEPETKSSMDYSEKKVSGKDYVYYGDNNDFPQYLWGLYLHSAITQSIINGTADYISGQGIILNRVPVNMQKYVNRDGETLEDIIKRVTLDYMIFGGFALQLIFDKTRQLSEIYYMDLQDIRLNEDENTVYFSKKWGKYNNRVIEYPVFSPAEFNSNCVYYYKGSKTRGVYPIPTYIGALDAIETSCQIGKYHLNNIINNMDAATLVSFNNGTPSLTEQKDIERKIIKKFTGSSNAGRTVITFADNKDSAPTISKLADDQKDKKFEVLYKNTLYEIFIAFRAQPQLFGMPTENKGFSKEEFMQIFELYNKTVVSPVQREIERVFSKLFGLENAVKLKSFELVKTEDNTEIA